MFEVVNKKTKMVYDIILHFPLISLPDMFWINCLFFLAANGYARSEAVIIVYLQKAKDARRVYATVIHAKTNCDGYKEQGITYPSGPLQQRLLEEFYEECQEMCIRDRYCKGPW